MRQGAAVLVATAAAAFGVAASSGTGVGTATAACPTRTVAVSFDPKRNVVIGDGLRTIASASFTGATISSRCRRVAQPRGFVDGGLGTVNRTRTSFRCLSARPIRIHVNPIRNGDTGKRVGTALQVGIATARGRLRVIVSAVLKDRGDPRASRLYSAAAFCKLGA